MGADKGSAGRRGNRTLLPDAYEIPHFAPTIKQESGAECGIIEVLKRFKPARLHEARRRHSDEAWIYAD